MRESVLHSDILSEIIKGANESVLSNVSAYLNVHDLLTFTSVSVYEVLFGLMSKPALQQANRFLALVEAHREIVPDKEDYRLAASIRAALRLRGTPIGHADPVIAACSLRKGVVLITGNTRHYEYMVEAGFQIELANWRES